MALSLGGSRRGGDGDLEPHACQWWPSIQLCGGVAGTPSVGEREDTDGLEITGGGGIWGSGLRLESRATLVACFAKSVVRGKVRLSNPVGGSCGWFWFSVKSLRVSCWAVACFLLAPVAGFLTVNGSIKIPR